MTFGHLLLKRFKGVFSPLWFILFLHIPPVAYCHHVGKTYLNNVTSILEIPTLLKCVNWAVKQQNVCVVMGRG